MNPFSDYQANLGRNLRARFSYVGFSLVLYMLRFTLPRLPLCSAANGERLSDGRRFC